MDNPDALQIDAETDGFSLIDVSASDDDFLLASSSDVSIEDNPGFAGGTLIHPPSDSFAFQRPLKNGKCNLRKSLAWDSAFFTNAGVLDPEELSSIIEGAETCVKQNSFLPGIQEELSKSTDSISTFQSDLTLESLEADLFCDIRASIQRCSKSSTTGNSCGSKILRKEKSTDGCSTKNAEPSSHKLANPKLSSNKLNSGVQGRVRTLKPISVSKQDKPPINRSREPTSLLSKQLKVVGDPTIKRMSVGAGCVKQDANAVGNVMGEGASVPKTSRQVNPRKPLPKAQIFSKTSAASLVLNRSTTHSSRSSCDSSSSSPSESVQKSQTGVTRRKIDKNVNLPSGSKTKTSSKVVEKVKSQNKESRLSAYVKSTSNLSPSISPASSISEWSTESSSSTATVNQKHFGFNPRLPSSKDVTGESDTSRNMHKLSIDRALAGQDHQVSGISKQSLQQPSAGDVASNTGPGFAKPSGLRKPSPNIGFFDGVKAVARTPSSSRSRSALPSNLPGSVSGTLSPFGTTNKTKLGTSTSKMTSAAAGTAKPKQLTTGANLQTPARLRGNAVDLQNLSTAKKIDNNSETSSKVKRSIPARSFAETFNVGKHASDSWLVGEDKLSCNHLTDDAVDKASSELLISNSPKSGIENNNKIPKVSELGNHVSDSELVGKDNLSSDQVTVAAEDGPKIDARSFETNLESSACAQDLSLGLLNSPSAASKLSGSNLYKSALKNNSKVDEVIDEGKQALDLASVTEGNLVASEKETNTEGKLLVTIDPDNVNVINQVKIDPQGTDLNLTPTAQLQSASRTKEVYDNFYCERLNRSSQNFASERLEEADDKYSHPDDLTTSESEEILHLTNDLVTAISKDCCASPHSNIEQRNTNNSSAFYDLIPSQEVGEAANSEEHMQHGPCNDNLCSKNELVEVKENV
ncbi:uncharacterized protein LOC130827646 isoform X2 [Amaranthus tricolor]|uniref:uncharacterized protein LOC130827646 isoform X2 n=1 Tax=Amaranthus tricolor TaxID=29722 RepID=UPI0025883052|nr:uncharacterized protein LOC130827646 isoform X2 [Amaranthus tricolor]